METYENLQEEYLKNIIKLGFSGDGLKFILMNSNTWDYDLPESISSHPTIILDIKNWALEQR